MGVVYRAEDTRLGRTVALKFLPAALARDPAAKERLLVEARAAATLDHPNVCTVYEVAETADGRPYIALACYDGETLAQRLERGPVPAEEAVRIARGVAAGVAAAHARGIVHRDLKPSNVFLCEDGTPKVLDFGVAKVPGVALTKTGHTAGTVVYGAPEQASGDADARSDVWAVGVVLYEMLTGARPFAASYEAAVLYAVLHEDPPPPSTLADVPPALDAVVARCLAKDPADRYADAAALGDALDAVLQPDAAPVAPFRLALVARRLRRSRLGLALAAVILVGLVAAGWWSVRAADATGLPDAIHLAILPPEAIPDGADEQAFAQGLAEMLAGGVAEMAPPDRDVWVVPVSEVRALDVASARQAGTVLGATLALTGTLRREGGRLTLTLALTTADDRPRLVGSRTLTVARADEASLRARALTLVADLLDFPVDDAERLALSTDDPEAQDYYLRGIGYLERDRDAEDLDRAIDFFQQAIDVDSAFVEAHARLAEAALARYKATLDPGWVGRAQAAADRADALDPDNVAVLVTRSKLALTTGEGPQAMRYARRALALGAGSADALRALAAAQEAQSDLEGAEATLREILSRAPARWTSAFELGAFFLRHQRLDEAAAQFQAVVGLAPENYQGYSGLGAARFGAGDLDGAEAAYQRVVGLRPDASGVFNLATVLLKKGNARGATARFRQVLAQDSSNHIVWRNLASAYWDLGDRARRTDAMRGALRQAEVGLAVNPNDPALLAAAATYREGTGDPDGARRDVRRAAALAPADPGVQYEAGQVLALLGDTDAALDALSAAAREGHTFEDVADDPALVPLLTHPRFPRSPR